jgi:hypothetical protein
MKKVFSISLSILMLTAMLHISVAEHFCGGKETGVKISLTGKLAACSMESSEKEQPLPSGVNITKHCCEDFITFCVIDNNYAPTFSYVPESFQFEFQFLALPIELSAKSQTAINSLCANVSPPGVLMSTNVDLTDICVFRI